MKTCDIYGCIKRSVCRVKNIGTGNEMELCKFHRGGYIGYPMITEIRKVELKA